MIVVICALMAGFADPSCIDVMNDKVRKDVKESVHNFTVDLDESDSQTL